MPLLNILWSKRLVRNASRIVLKNISPILVTKIWQYGGKHHSTLLLPYLVDVFAVGIVVFVYLGIVSIILFGMSLLFA